MVERLDNNMTHSPATTTPSNETQSLVPPPHALVIFGASGDLTRRKLIPALYSLFLRDLLPEGAFIIGFARREKTDQSFRAELRKAMDDFALDGPVDDRRWAAFASKIYYHQSTFEDADGYRRLCKRIDELAAAGNVPPNVLFYLAAQPASVPVILDNLGECGLTRIGRTEQPWARVVVEKPFGRDLESACELNRKFRGVFDEGQIFRIDHYLGKETVQNILVLRFANAMFEPIWNKKYVDHVQISVAEKIGIEGRGRFYEQAGVIRDMLQNHMMHLLCLVAMEPPGSLDANAIRDEKVKLLKALRPLSHDCVFDEAVLGQYTAGAVDGRKIPGYLQAESVPPDSATPTFVALRAFIENWRWAGVPFYLRTGKALPARITEILIHFKRVPKVLFGAMPNVELTRNILAIRIQPDEGISWQLHVKRPGPGMHIEPTRMDFSYGETFATAPPDAYQRLLLDAARGDPTLFARSDEVEAAWEYLMPILAGCASRPERLEKYAAGTWGPDGSERLIKIDNRQWQLTRRMRS